MENKDRLAGGYETMMSDQEDKLVDQGQPSTGDRAKEKLASAARVLRDQGADKLGTTATNLLKQGESYLGNADLSPVRADIERLIRQYPIPAIVAGALAGYLLAHRGALKALAFGVGVGYLVSRTRPK